MLLRKPVGFNRMSGPISFPDSHQRKVFLTLNIIVSLSSAGYWLWLIFPGKYSTDNIMMLVESFPHAGVGTQHSVMFIMMLKAFHRVFGYGLAYPAVWGIFFWFIGCISFTQAIYNLTGKGHSLIVTLVLFHLPSIVFILPYIQIKDISMSAALFAGYGVLFYCETSSHPARWRLVSVMFFVLAVGFRHNAFIAVIPAALVFGGLISQKWNAVQTRFTRLSIQVLAGAIMLATLIITKLAFEYSTRDYRNYFTEGALFYFDLAGISVKTETLLIPEDRLVPGTTIDTLKRIHSEKGWDPLWGGWDSPTRILRNGDQREDLAGLADAWLSAVAQYPGAYIAHRSEHFYAFRHYHNTYRDYELPVDGKRLWQGTMASTPAHLRDASPLNNISATDFEITHFRVLNGYQRVHAFLSQKIGRWFYATSGHFCLKILSGLMVVGVLFLVLDHLKKVILSPQQKTLLRQGLLICSSGWIYFNAYFIVSISCDWRYIHWSQLSMYIGAALMAFAIKRPRTGTTDRE
jgi:hypothetical protein